MTLRPPSPIRKRHLLARGFTLIELVLSSALMSIVLIASYACLNAGFASQKVIEPRTDLLQTARAVLALLSADLRGACPLPQGPAFLGTRRNLGTIPADNLDFATHHYTPQRPGEGDFCEESLFVDRDARTGQYSLWRRRNPRLAFDPLSGGSREELAPGIAGLRLEYFDGLDWYESWGDPKAGSTKSQLKLAKPNETGLPEAVRITLLMTGSSNRRDASPEPPLVFQTTVHLNAPSSGSSGGSGPASSTPDSASPGIPQ